MLLRRDSSRNTQPARCAGTWSAWSLLVVINTSSI
jgi:hypothetical protein